MTALFSFPPANVQKYTLSISTNKWLFLHNFCKKNEKTAKKFADSKNVSTFAIPFGKFAEIAQLVEHNLAKVGVASSSLVFRSKESAEMLT